MKFVYFTFDDDVQRAAAQADPVGYVADLPERAVLDEVQRAPGLLSSIKAAVDLDRRPGRFLLAGSARSPFRRSPTLSADERSCMLSGRCRRAR